MQMHKIAIKRQIVKTSMHPPPTLNRVVDSLPAPPHRAFGPGPMQWNFIEPPHLPHTWSSCPRFCTIFERPLPVNLTKLFGRENARERLFRVIRWRCGWMDAGRGAPPARGRYGRKGNGLDVTHPVKRPNYARCLQTSQQNAIKNCEMPNMTSNQHLCPNLQLLIFINSVSCHLEPLANGLLPMGRP